MKRLSQFFSFYLKITFGNSLKAILAISASWHELLFGIVGLMAHLAFDVFDAYGVGSDHLNGSHQSDYHGMTFSLELFHFRCLLDVCFIV